jgi:ABC-2 type transport system ATP-binding protein
MTAIINTNGLTRKFGDKTAVDQLTLEVQAGEIFGFLGHNGAGKTTTVRLLNGVLDAQAGTASVLGLSPAKNGPALRRRTGVLTETPSVDERLTARDNLRIYAELYDVPREQVRRRVDEMLELFELSDRASEKVGGFSKGMKQRLALARALLHKPDLLFLDEPTSGLDPVAAKQVRDMITHFSRDEGNTAFICTHNLVEAQRLCDRVGVMEHGRLLAVGTPSELARQLGSRARIELEVASAQVSHAQKVLQGTADDVTVEHDTLIVAGVDREFIPKALAALVTAGISVYRVTPGEPSLEDIYFIIHGRNEGVQ